MDLDDQMDYVGDRAVLDHAFEQVEFVPGNWDPGPAPPAQRRYLPTLSDLVDRLSIVQQKAIFIRERRAEYVEEMSLIMHDIDLILSGSDCRVGAKEVRAILVIMLANRFIWENESKAREGGPDQDRRLKATHSINGVRNTAKNVLAGLDKGRHDYKVDCFAAELIEEFGDWNVFG